jgi:drug/metabolite transporter (DMT)-like permease
MSNRLVVPLVAVAAVFWGANFNLAPMVLADMPPLWGAAGRFLIAALVMTAAAAAFRQDPIRFTLKHVRPLFILGALGIAGFNLPFYWAMQSTSPINAALIMATNPLLTAALATLFLGEGLSVRNLATLPLALAGVAAVVLGTGQTGTVTFNHGDLLMMAANLAWAGYNVMSRRLMPAGAPFAATAGTMAAGALVLTVAALAGAGMPPVPGPKAGAALLVMAVGGSALAYLFWAQGIRTLGAARTSLFLNLVPVTTMVLSSLDGLPPTPAQGAGGLMVLVAVTLSALPDRKAARS